MTERVFTDIERWEELRKLLTNTLTLPITGEGAKSGIRIALNFMDRIEEAEKND